MQHAAWAGALVNHRHRGAQFTQSLTNAQAFKVCSYLKALSLLQLLRRLMWTIRSIHGQNG